MSAGESFWDETRIATRAALDYMASFTEPTLRLGVTGLSRAGKTVFITALVQAFLRGGRFPAFGPLAQGRIASARLVQQPDDAVPRFPVEEHLSSITGKARRWPESTNRISELRLEIDFQSEGWFGKPMRRLTLDIVDYPGEWLLDLPLLAKDFATWSAETLKLSRVGTRAPLAAEWHAHLASHDPSKPADEPWINESARLFAAYLKRCRDERFAMSLLPPGRFLMPGDLAGTPALTFAPVEIDGDDAPRGSLRAEMARRYEAYKTVVVRPFFRDHFARLDRQIVLVDALSALNSGPQALADLESALKEILEAFRPGRNSWLSSIFRPRVDRVLFAATKADHLHQTSHDRLQAILRRLADRAIRRASFMGARVEVVALAAVRATREATVTRDGETLNCIAGTPAAGERAGDTVFDGETEIAMFPGDLPEDPASLFGEKAAETFRGLAEVAAGDADYRFVRFRPPRLTDGAQAPLPHIRLDHALEFLFADRLA
jgi:hypothetical protein